MENFKKAMIIRGGNVIGAVGDKNFSTAPIGAVLAYAGNEAPRGYLLADGASYPTTEYPDLYAVIGNTYGGDTENFNVPDYRETVLVGVGENTTDTIASHDVYELGEFKDDQLQNHTHTETHLNQGDTWGWAGSSFRIDPTLTKQTSNPNNARTGTTTHGKQKGVTYIIKAFHTNEGVDSGVSDDVVEYVDNKINDSEIQTNTTWSSSKINEELEDVRNELDIIVEEANKNTTINDELESLTTTWSSSKIASTMPTTRSLTLKSGYSGYITEVYDPTTKVVVYNVNVFGTFKGLLNSVADGFKIPKGSTSSSDVMHKTIGIYGSNSAMTGDAQFTRLLIRNYGNPHLEVDVNAENTIVSGTITYVTT